MATEKRLVYAEEVMELICGMDSLPWEETAQEMVESLTTVDAVEVVRCKDCAWCHQFEDLNYCENPNAPWIDEPDFDDVTVADNDFCSYGERKDNER